MKKNNILNWQWFVLTTILVALSLSLLLTLYEFAPIFNVKIKDLPLLIAIIVCGVPLVFNILLRLIKRDLGADLLAAIAILTGVFLKEYLAVTIVMLMLASGQILELYAVHRASAVLLALAKRMPAKSHLKIGKAIKDIALRKIKIGDLIVLYPHETCPIDGVVVQGYGSMDESYLTGEPYYIPKAPGATVLSGSINGEAMLVITTEKKAQDSRYAKIMKVMEESEQHRPQIRRLADQLGAIFAPLVLIFAAITWYFTDDAVRFLAVLVIATPCPLLIAIPITIISAISLAARKGIIIKDPTVLEQLPRCTTAIFDKTGTLTYGQAELTKITVVPGFDKNKVLQQVASLERFSKHPLAKAILKAAQEANLVLSEVERVSENPGQGLIGQIAGRTIQITGRAKLSIALPLTQKGLECIILVDKKVAAVFNFRDTIRTESKSFIRHLSPVHYFKKVMIISGDRASEVKDIAKQLKIKKFYAEQTPEQKVAIVRKETALAPTLFMGDGINDAPALAAATVGIAFGQHNIVTTETAGAVILESSLDRVDELIHISELMRSVALLSAGGGMLLTFVGMGFAAVGTITPVMGAILQEGIDVLAILNALQLTWRYSKVKH